MLTKDLMKSLGEELELKYGLVEESDGVYRLDLDFDQYVTFVELDEGVYIYSTIGQLPSGSVEVFLQDLMHANLFGQGTGGGVIGLDDDKNLTLSLAINYEPDYEDFRDQFEDFLNYLDLWKGELQDVQPKGTEGAFF